MRARAAILALRSLRRFRLRSGLAALGVAVGVALWIVMTSLGLGARREVEHQIERLGARQLLVRPRALELDGLRERGFGIVRSLSLEDCAAIEAECPSVSLCAPAALGSVELKRGGLAIEATLVGTSANYGRIRELQLAQGRLFDVEEERRRARVVVLGARIAEALFGARPALEQSVRMGGLPFRVIGVASPKGVGLDGGSGEDESVWIPVGTALRRVFDDWHLGLIYLEARAERDAPAERLVARLAAARDEVQSLLCRRHASARPDFTIDDQSRLIAASRAAGGAFERLGSGLALVTLLLGGVGIASIQWLAVRERSREIGLRLALGARPRDILAQLVWEGLALGAGGAVGGLALGLGSAWALGRWTQWSSALAPASVLAPVLAALAIGLTSGVLPARRAAHADPMRALSAQ